MISNLCLPIMIMVISNSSLSTEGQRGGGPAGEGQNNSGF